MIERLEAIVLAGGAGTRFGGGKLIAPWQGGALIDGALETAFAAPVRTVTLVTGADRAVDGAARRFAERIAQGPRLKVVHCPGHAEGMGATLRAGVASLPTDAAGAFVFLGDMPRIPAKVLPALANALAAGALAAAPVFEDQRGHPVLFSASLFAELRALTGDAGARAALRGLGERLALVRTDDPGVLFDVDRPDDLNSSDMP